MSEVRHASVKKVSLAGVSEAWDDECYAYMTPATYQDNAELNKLDFENMTEDEQVAFQLKFVREHFISGKIRVFNGTEFVLVDMRPEDTAASVAITDCLYAATMGFDLDPKDIRKAVLSNALQSNAENNTETTSSEESPLESTDK